MRDNCNQSSFSLEKAASTRKRLVRSDTYTDRGHETVLVRAGRSWLLAVARWTIWYGDEGYQPVLLSLHRHFAWAEWIRPSHPIDLRKKLIGEDRRALDFHSHHHHYYYYHIRSFHQCDTSTRNRKAKRPDYYILAKKIKTSLSGCFITLSSRKFPNDPSLTYMSPLIETHCLSRNKIVQLMSK